MLRSVEVEVTGEWGSFSVVEPLSLAVGMPARWSLFSASASLCCSS